MNGLPPGFLASNPALASQVQAAAGSFPRSFNQDVAFGKINGVINDKNNISATYNYQRFRSPHGYFNTPTSTGDGLSLTDGATSHFFQLSLQTAFNNTTVNEARFHYGSDYHFDLPSTPATSPAVTIQNPDTGFVFGGNRFQLANTDRRYEVTDNLTKNPWQTHSEGGCRHKYQPQLGFLYLWAQGRIPFRQPDGRAVRQF